MHVGHQGWQHEQVCRWMVSDLRRRPEAWRQEVEKGNENEADQFGRQEGRKEGQQKGRHEGWPEALVRAAVVFEPQSRCLGCPFPD
jgi:predicted transposase YdaD